MPGPGFEFIGKEEEQEVLEVLRSGWLFRYGDEKNSAFKRKVKSFEAMVEEGFGVKNALAVTSGTAALITALSALGIGPGDEVIVPGYTFIASLSSIIVARAVPVLAEVDDSLTVDPADVEQKITPRTKAIMAVHMLGNPCNLDALREIARKRGILLIEDAAQAFGGSWKGRKLGTVGTIGIYSFNNCKTITAGDGGMVVTDDRELYLRAFGYHDQGHLPNRSGVEVGNRSLIGQNYRMTELTGAVLIAQFRKLPLILERLRQIKARLKGHLDGAPGVSFRRINDVDGECNTLLTVFLPTKEVAEKVAAKLGTVTMSKSGWHVYNNMEQILGKKTIIDRGCPYNCSSYPCAQDYRKGMLPNTDRLLERAINLSVGVVDRGLGSGFGIRPHSTDQEIDQKAEQFLSALREST